MTGQVGRPYDPEVGRRRDHAAAWTSTVVAACAAVLVIAWPADPETAQRSWYVLTGVRAMIVAAWGAWLGTAPLRGHDRHRTRWDVGWLVAGSGATVPLDAVAWAATQPTTPAAWAIGAGAVVGVATFGIVAFASTWVAKLGGMPEAGRQWRFGRRLAVLCLAASPFVLPVIVRAPSALPGQLPASPGVATAALLVAGCALAAPFTHERLAVAVAARLGPMLGWRTRP